MFPVQDGIKLQRKGRVSTSYQYVCDSSKVERIWYNCSSKNIKQEKNLFITEFIFVCPWKTPFCHLYTVYKLMFYVCWNFSQLFTRVPTKKQNKTEKFDLSSWAVSRTALSQDKCFPGQNWFKLNAVPDSVKWKLRAFLDRDDSRGTLSWIALSQAEHFPGQRWVKRKAQCHTFFSLWFVLFHFWWF